MFKKLLYPTIVTVLFLVAFPVYLMYLQKFSIQAYLNKENVEIQIIIQKAAAIAERNKIIAESLKDNESILLYDLLKNNSTINLQLDKNLFSKPQPIGVRPGSVTPTK